MPLHQRVRSLLGGRLRLSQQRELYRIESLLLSHACLLLGDLNENDLAERYGMAGLAFAREAGSDQAVAMTVLAKTFRWQKRLTESMDMARRGFACSPDAPIRVQLASQEANAAALLGDAARARAALARAERAAVGADCRGLAARCPQVEGRGDGRVDAQAEAGVGAVPGEGDGVALGQDRVVAGVVQDELPVGEDVI
jgi:hypothetical protein